MLKPQFTIRVVLVAVTVITLAIPIGFGFSRLSAEYQESHRYLTLQSKFEKQYEAKIRRCLSDVTGVRIAVRIDLEWQAHKHDPQIATLKPVRGIATIRIPRTYVAKFAIQGNAAGFADAWQMVNKNVADAVVGLLPQHHGDDPYPQVTVTLSGPAIVTATRTGP